MGLEFGFNTANLLYTKSRTMPLITLKCLLSECIGTCYTVEGDTPFHMLHGRVYAKANAPPAVRRPCWRPVSLVI